MAYQSNYTGSQIDAGISKTTKMTADGDNVTFAGKVTVSTAPTNNNDVATKEYVDDLGDTIGEQVSDLQSDFANIGYTEELSANLLDTDEIEAGRITSSSSVPLHTGTYDTDYKTTGFIPVTGGKKYGFFVKITVGDIVNCAVSNIWAYDESQEGLSYLGSSSYNASGTTYITAPANAKYIRASLVASTFTNFAFVQFSETEGTAPSELVPYKKDIYLDGYVRTAELEAINTEVNDIKAVIDDNFTDVYDVITGGTIEVNKYIDANGVVTDITTAWNTTTINANAGDKFKITAKAYLNAYYYAFYDSSDTFLEGLKSTQSGTTEINDVVVIAPTNTAYLVAVGITTYATIKGVTGRGILPWAGKKWVCIGDSLTEVNIRTSKHYFDYVAEVTGITTVNMGDSGSGYAREQDIGTAFYQRISNCPTDADVVTIFGSFNDLGASLSLGTVDDTGTTTIAGCINTTIDNLFSVFPLANLGIVAPTPWMGSQPSTSGNAYNYVEMLKAICERRSIPFLDLWRCSGLRPWDAEFRALAYSKDDGNGTHPDETGHKIIAPRFKAFLETLLL